MLLRLRHCISRPEVTPFLTVILVGGLLVSFVGFSWQTIIGPVLDCICHLVDLALAVLENWCIYAISMTLVLKVLKKHQLAHHIF